MMTVNLPMKVRPGDSVRATAFNALIDAVRAVMPIRGQNVRVSYSAAGAKIDAVAGARGGGSFAVEYWQVKWDADAECWAIEIKPDSVIGNGVAGIQNERIGATGDWYKVDGSPSATTEGVCRVIVHVKRNVRIGEGSVRACVYCAATEVGEDEPGSEEPNHSAGDAYTIPVATCTIAASEDDEGETVYTRTVQKLCSQNVQMDVQPYTTLDLLWTCPDVGDDDWNVFTPAVQAVAVAPLAGVPMEETELPAEGHVPVYYQIECGDNYTPSIETEDNASFSTIAILIYWLNDGVVTEDRRSAVTEQVFFP